LLKLLEPFGITVLRVTGCTFSCFPNKLPVSNNCIIYLMNGKKIALKIYFLNLGAVISNHRNWQVES
jgi:hypothetical protein